MRWFRRHHDDEMAKARAEQEAKLRVAQRMTPHYERFAEVIADLSDEELAERFRRAMMWRPA